METESIEAITYLYGEIEILKIDTMWSKIKIDPTNDAGKRANEYLIQAKADLIRAQKNLERVIE
jgi:hypothetical protein